MSRWGYTQTSGSVAYCIASSVAEGCHERETTARASAKLVSKLVSKPLFDRKHAGYCGILRGSATRWAAVRSTAGSCACTSAGNAPGRLRRKDHGSFGNARWRRASEWYLHAQRQSRRLRLSSDIFSDYLEQPHRDPCRFLSSRRTAGSQAPRANQG